VRRDLILVLVIAAIAFGVRVYPPWKAIFDGEAINFLETDAWYHIRLIENQVHNWPWRVTLDPYAAPGGQFVPVAPLFDTLISTAVVMVHGRDADLRSIERIAAFAPAVLGATAVVVAWALALHVFGPLAAVLTAALLAVLPGHFLDRTLLGFVDHHALEALLALAVFWSIARALQRPTLTRDVLSGVMVGLYLMAWGSGAFLVATLTLWLVVLILLAREVGELIRLARVLGTAATVAFLLVALFQDPGMHRYGSQLLSLVLLAIVALAVVATHRSRASLPPKAVVIAGLGVAGGAALLLIFWLAPDLTRQVIFDVRRLAPDSARMNVLEARPLFWYPGQWTWSQPWAFFRSGFFVGVIGLIALSVRAWRLRRPMDVGIVAFGIMSFAATIGQNRFGYYLVPASALVGGYLAARVLDWGTAASAADPPARRSIPFAREIAAVIVVAAIFGPNLAPSVLAASRTGTLPIYWRESMAWLRARTPPPFTAAAGADDTFYLARYPQQAIRPDYSVLNWWDHGYWIIQLARRVPVANPTQGGAPSVARFYVETDEAAAEAVLDREGSRYVVADWELPFRLTAQGSVMGRFQSVADWAGAEHARYYEVYYRREGAEWTPVWVFHQPYYQTMVYRLMVMGGRAALPSNGTTVITVGDRTDGDGLRFREVISEQTYASYDAAVHAAAQSTAQQTLIVGLDPWRPAFPIQPVRSLVQVYAARTSEQAQAEAPWVRIFERRR
jgi:oligosaccharyl transferase (archaeosortase A-associated)